MKYKYYIITLPSDIDYKELNNFHEKITSTKGILGWFHYIVGTYVIKVAPNVTANHIMEIVWEILPEEYLFFVAEINLNNVNGKVTKIVKDWLDNERENNDTLEFSMV